MGWWTIFVIASCVTSPVQTFDVVFDAGTFVLRSITDDADEQPHMEKVVEREVGGFDGCTIDKIRALLTRVISDTSRSGGLPASLYENVWAGAKDDTSTPNVGDDWRIQHVRYLLGLLPPCPKSDILLTRDPLPEVVPWDVAKLRLAFQFGQDAVKAHDRLGTHAGEFVERVVEALGELGEPVRSDIEASAARFDAFLKQMTAKGPFHHNTEEGWVLGHPTHIIFGKFVGDLLDIHPIVAALLNPAGGIVGQGAGSAKLLNNIAVNWLKIRPRSLNRHAVVHDAMGMLYRVYRKGPGYTYARDRPTLHEAKTPIEGNVSGIRFWRNVILKAQEAHNRANPKQYKQTRRGMRLKTAR